MSDIIKDAFENLDPNNLQFVDKNLEITEKVYAIMKKKGISQKELAEKMGEKPSEISKYLSGMHNLTLRSITKMEVALGEDIIMTCNKAKEVFTVTNFIFKPMEFFTNEPKINSVKTPTRTTNFKVRKTKNEKQL
jgi:transcriptional regulator with XRE-family HTH domain